MASKFRENLNLWGTIIFGGLITVGAATRAIQYFIGDSDSKSSSKVSMSLTAAEQEEVNRIKSAGNLAGQMGHELSPNTRLVVVTDNFGEHAKCAVHIRGMDPAGRAPQVSANWDLVIQQGGGSDIVWTNNLIGPSTGEIRLSLDDSGTAYKLNMRVSDSGRGMLMDSKAIKEMLGAKSAKANSGLYLGSESSMQYDLSSLQKAYKYAKAICA